MIDFAVIDETRAARWCPPPAPRTFGQFAPTLLLPDGRAAGEPWDFGSEPVQTVWVQQCDVPRWQVMLGAMSSQRGKTLMGVALPLLHAACERRTHVAYVMPNLEKLTQAWETKLKPLMDGCGFTAWLPTKGPGSRGGKPAVLQLREPVSQARAGACYFLAAGGGGKETSLASVTAPTVIVDEGDDLEDEGHLGLAFRRVRSFGEDYRIYIMSTVNERRNRDAHPILVLYERGTRSRLWYACPHCGRFQPLDWEQVKVDDLDCGYQCAHCPAIWTDDERHHALNRWQLVHAGQSIDESGRVVGPDPGGRFFSLVAWDLEFHMASMAQVAAEFRAARKSIEERADHSAMRQFYYKILCRDYRGDIDELEQGHELTWQSLLRRSQQCKWGPTRHSSDKSEKGMGFTYSRHIADVPADAAFCCAGVDVQSNRVYTSLVAASMDGTTYDVAWSYELARRDQSPWNRQELHALLDRVDMLLHKWAGPTGLALAGLDVGDFLDDLTPWLKGKRGSAWRATRGKTTAMKDEPGDIEGLVRHRDGVLYLETDNLREIIHAAYRRPNATPGAAHIPNGLTSSSSDVAYMRHLVAEMMIIDPKSGRLKLRQGPGRWDWQDARRISEAMVRWNLAHINPPRRRIVKYGVVGTAGATI